MNIRQKIDDLAKNGSDDALIEISKLGDIYSGFDKKIMSVFDANGSDQAVALFDKMMRETSQRNALSGIKILGESERDDALLEIFSFVEGASASYKDQHERALTAVDVFRDDGSEIALTYADTLMDHFSQIVPQRIDILQQRAEVGDLHALAEIAEIAIDRPQFEQLALDAMAEIDTNQAQSCLIGLQGILEERKNEAEQQKQSIASIMKEFGLDRPPNDSFDADLNL